MNEHVAEPFRSILNATAEAVAPARIEPTPGPWEYIASTEHHGAYVMGPWGGDICDCYAMSQPGFASLRNGGTSRPIPFQHERMDANARLISAAPDLLEELRNMTAICAVAAPDHDLAIAWARAAIAKATGDA